MEKEIKEDPLLKNVYLKPLLLSRFSKEETIKLWTLYFKDSVIVAVRNYIIKHALSIEINLQLNELAYNYEHKIESFKHWAPFLIKAFDWLNIYGMVPWRMIEVNGIHKPEIPEIGTGELAMLFDEKTNMSYPVWIENDFELRKNEGFKSVYKRIMETNFRVTEGQNKKHMASIMNYQSNMALLIQDFYDFQEIKENLMVSDFNSSHPVFFVSKDQVKPAWKEMTDAQIFDPHAPDPLIDMAETYNRHFYEKVDELSKLANMPMGIKEFGRIDWNEGKGSVLRNRRFYDLKALPSGSKVDKQGQHVTTINYWEAIKSYQMKVCSLFSVQWIHLFGGIDILHKKSSIATANLSELRSTITNVRKEIEELVRDIYLKVYNTVDTTQTIINVIKLSRMTNSGELTTEDNEFLKKVKENASEINMPTLIFGSNTFIDNVNVQEMLLMYTAGVVTLEEARRLIVEKLNIKLDVDLDKADERELLKKVKVENETPEVHPKKKKEEEKKEEPKKEEPKKRPTGEKKNEERRKIKG